MICNYCGGKEFDTLAQYTRFENNNILQCKHCGLVFLELNKKKNEVVSFYTSSDYRRIPTAPVQSAEAHYNDKITQNDINNRIRFVSSHLNIKGKKVLEIGSASGGMLQKLLECGAKEVTGIELDKMYSKFARGRGLNIITRSIEELNFAGEYDAIVSFHTLEHVFDPMAIIKAVYAALKPGGVFLGEVPNQNDWRIRLFNNEVVKRFHYDPTHLYYYSPSTLANYFKTCGFKDIQFETVERYNSLLQLRNILCNWESIENVEDILHKYIFPENKKDETRLPDINNKVETEFNRIFAQAVNSELMGNCLRWVAR